jgi:CubicO group peptidase (beta-lactamase class C family)
MIMSVHGSSCAIRTVLRLAVLLIAVSSSARAQQDSTLQARVAGVLDAEYSRYLSGKPGFGAAIAVVDDKGIVWEKTFGQVDGDGSRMVDANTIFSIQSMSKSFTALAALMAVQDGLVDLDTPIKEYLPDFRVNSIYDEHPEESITLRLLLTHRAGLTFDAPFGSNYDDRYDFTKHIESISETWLRYPVGYRLSYSNTGIDLAAYILQVMSGMPFERYVKLKVLDPIGMNDSSLEMAWIEKRENRAIGHSDGSEIIPMRVPMIGAGGVYSSIRDMAKYLQFHINKGVVNGRRLLREDLIEEMHTIQFAWPRQRTGYCLGLLRDSVSHSYNLYHSGGGYGFTSDMVMYPELRLGVIDLCNSMDNEFTGYAVRYYIDGCVTAQEGATPVDDAGTRRMTRLDVEDPRVQAALGVYGDSRGGTRSIEQSEGKITIRLSPEEMNLDLQFYDDNGELVGLFGLFSEARFLQPYYGKRGSLVQVDRRLGSGPCFNIYDFNYAFDEPPGPDKPEWSQYLGEYVVLKYGVPYKYTGNVSVRNGHLFYNECRCTEHEPGLFFSYDGDALDFRSEPPTFAGIVLHRK